MVEGARLESVYTAKGYRGFESLTLSIYPIKLNTDAVFLNLVAILVVTQLHY